MDKTGSTSIQASLRQNSAILSDAGIFYSCEPSDTFAFGYTHLPITSSLRNEPYAVVPVEKRLDTTDLIAHLLKDFSRSRSPKLLLSDEHLSLLDEKHSLGRLKDEIGADEYSVICYVRKQHDWALSKYSTAVLCGRTQPFNFADVTPKNQLYDVLSKLNLWSEVFGEEAIVVRLFDRRTLVDSSVVKDFFGLLGVDLNTQEIEEVQLNESPSFSQIEAIRRCNKFLEAPRVGGNSSTEVTNNDSLRRDLLSNIPSEGSLRDLYRENQVEALLTEFAEHNMELAERFLTKEESDILLSDEEERSTERTTPDIEHCLAQALVNLKRSATGLL